MKILVVSDSHGNLANLQRAVQQFAPDCVLHLGDHWSDAMDLQKSLTVPLYAVPGNCDFGVREMTERLLEFEGVKIFMTHGHKYGVKQSPMRAMYAAEERQAQILCFGHTHRAICAQQTGLWVLNPGTCGGSRPTCGIIEIENSTAQCALHEIGEE